MSRLQDPKISRKWGDLCTHTHSTDDRRRISRSFRPKHRCEPRTTSLEASLGRITRICLVIRLATRHNLPLLRRGGSARELKIVVRLVVIWRGEARLLRRMLSGALVSKGVRLGGDHVDDSRLTLLRRRARRGGDTALLGSPALGILLHCFEFAALLEALLSSWHHRDRCVRRLHLRSLLVTTTEAPITHLVLCSLGLELFATRCTSFSNKLLEHVDCWSEVMKVLASRVRR